MCRAPGTGTFATILFIVLSRNVGIIKTFPVSNQRGFTRELVFNVALPILRMCIHGLLVDQDSLDGNWDWGCELHLVVLGMYVFVGALYVGGSSCMMG